MYSRVIKGMADRVLSLLALIVLLPVFLILVLIIKLDSKGPVLFKQKRVGKNHTLFTIYKFRTMRINTPKNCPTHQLKKPDQYITKVGRLLRRSSLDELPQIFNILAGDMSIVGPRPALWNQKDLIREREKYGANRIKPGLTGWAQINGRDELPIDQKAKLDGEYVKRVSFFFDLRCLLVTAVSVFKMEGIKEGAFISEEKTKEFSR